MRFVILDHSCSGQTHWDLMLEQGQKLVTWQVRCSPETWGSSPMVHCEKIFDHRLKYLSYQGPLSDERGAVQPVAAGAYEVLEMDEKSWCILLTGPALKGRLTLKFCKDNQWQLIFEGEYYGPDAPE